MCVRENMVPKESTIGESINEEVETELTKTTKHVFVRLVNRFAFRHRDFHPLDVLRQNYE